MKKLTLVKYDWKSFPKKWRKENSPNPHEGVTFIYLGEIQKMNGHGYFQDISNGQPIILHIDSMVALKRKEL